MKRVVNDKVKKKYTINSLLRKLSVVVIATSCLALLAGCGKNGRSEHVSAGMSEIENGEYDAALSCFDEAEAAGENKELILRGRGIAYIGKTDYASAIDSLTSALSECDGNLTDLEYDINYYLATAYYKSGAYEDAYTAYSAILALKSSEADSYYLRGCCSLAMNNYELAVSDFDKAVNSDSKNCSLYINIFRALSDNGHADIGMEYLEKAMNNGSKTMSDYDRGRICYYMGDYENACSYLDNANKNNSSEEVVLALGQSYEATGDINFAASIYTNYLSSNGDSASIYNQLGLCRLATGDYDAALSSIESGIAMNDADVMQTLKYNEIICYEYLGDFTKAKVLMESYLVVYPDDETALREYDFLATR
ncbi:MAG: tetratricopeptide repeat protein [Lachnospiraceae bacterium]|nr:tetratricopeptide repeat protein [Candidatus Merdinaster equi]